MSVTNAGLFDEAFALVGSCNGMSGVVIVMRQIQFWSKPCSRVHLTVGPITCVWLVVLLPDNSRSYRADMKVRETGRTEVSSWNRRSGSYHADMNVRKNMVWAFSTGLLCGLSTRAHRTCPPQRGCLYPTELGASLLGFEHLSFPNIGHTPQTDHGLVCPSPPWLSIDQFQSKHVPHSMR